MRMYAPLRSITGRLWLDPIVCEPTLLLLLTCADLLQYVI